MKRYIVYAALLLLLTHCSDANQSNSSAKGGGATPRVQASSGLRTITPKEAVQLLGSRKDLVVLDVRTVEERQAYGAIQGGHLVPFWAIMQDKLKIGHDVPILLYCAVGGRSFFAGQMLMRHGYKEVYNLQGGIDAWIKAGLPVS